MTLLSRRNCLLAGAATAGSFRLSRCLAGATAATPESADRLPDWPLRYCLNTSTIRGADLPLDKQVEIAAQAGYDAVEPWTRDIEAFIQAGGRLRDLKKKIDDAGLAVKGAIGFARWAVDDDKDRAAGLMQLKTEMQWLAELGSPRIAASPAGIHNVPDVDLDRVAERYAATLALGRKTGVTPQLEIWGNGQSLATLAEAAYVVTACDDKDACLLPDVFHLYKGGSPFAGLGMLHGGIIRQFHMNDYPANPPRKEIGDGDRVFPGDGVAPLAAILRTLRAIGFRGVLSLELFNRDYWKRPPLEVAREGLAKMRQAVAASMQ